MNCCDDFGKCVGGHGCAVHSEPLCSAPSKTSKWTCEELGVCQARAECRQAPLPRYPFAPGVIDRGEPVSRADVLGRWVLAGVCLAALAAVVGLAAGYISVAGLL